MFGLTASQFSVTVPDGLEGEVSFSKAYANYYKNGRVSSFALDMTCEVLQKHRTVKAKEIEILIPKVEGVLAAWGKELMRKRDQEGRGEFHGYPAATPEALEGHKTVSQYVANFFAAYLRQDSRESSVSVARS